MKIRWKLFFASPVVAALIGLWSCRKNEAEKSVVNVGSTNGDATIGDSTIKVENSGPGVQQNNFGSGSINNR